VVAAVLAAGCGTDTAATVPTQRSTTTTVQPASTSTPPSTTTVQRSTTTTDSPTATSTIGVATNTAVQGLLDQWAHDGRGGVAVALAGHDDEMTVAAAGSAGPDGGTVEPGSAFRVGSLTKTFVAVMLLQLVADGTIGLDDLVVAHAAELTIADGVTIRQLLAHRSGIPEHTDRELAPAVLADPARTWTPADLLRLVADQPRDFAPDAQFADSNTNYIVAGLPSSLTTDRPQGRSTETG
jgi:D-alanyl-D-alanine carboxypeptidase